MTEVRGSAYLK
ncbi:hypothetical protein F383_06331 [Gossypium arboreum]|uniref:Uncharacterized protein n=1 Tax=Gossypium arboreum TaxID=29729 RepID=A0A0B0N6T8_GOSAR|nr:hypothetical protein F383_06331 [Gossypium arboreum]